MANANITLDDKKFLRRLGSRIRSIRIERNWTLEQTEEKGWNNWQHLQKIEAGKNITVVTLRKVAQLYKMPLAKLLEEF